MPNSRMANAGQTDLQRRSCGIIRITALWPLCRYRHNAHWSGAPDRLARDMSGGFGSASYAKEELVALSGQSAPPLHWVRRTCPGSEQEGPARDAQCPHERRSGARGRRLFAHLGKSGDGGRGKGATGHG